MNKYQTDTINNLRLQGVRFNIVTNVDRRVELHYEVETLRGKRVSFVAEVGDLGNITEWGDAYSSNSVSSNAFFNADGERFAA